MVLTDPQFVSMDVQKMMETFLKPSALEFVEAGQKTVMVAAVITVLGVLIMLVGTIVCLWKLVQKMSEYQVKDEKPWKAWQAWNSRKRKLKSGTSSRPMATSWRTTTTIQSACAVETTRSKTWDFSSLISNLLNKNLSAKSGISFERVSLAPRAELAFRRGKILFCATRFYYFFLRFCWIVDFWRKFISKKKSGPF